MGSMNKWQIGGLIASGICAVLSIAGAVCSAKATDIQIDQAVVKRLNEYNKQPNNK